MTGREFNQETTTIQSASHESLRLLATELAHDGLEEASLRIRDLANRLQNPERIVHVALCGLFSAGKSSLINTLVGTTVTATGAVPTTAAIHNIEWETPQGKLILMDTPGIDSTDEAHEQVTEAALHLADAVCLVVDYSHVESEETLEFARVLTERGIPLFLVVHQIDKHLEFELSWDMFTRRVESSFEDYGIEYETIFYTSLKPGPHNQIDLLRKRLFHLVTTADEVILTSVRKNALSVIRQAVTDSLAEKSSDTAQAIEDGFGQLPLDREEAEVWLSELQSSLETETSQLQELEDEVRKTFRSAKESFLRSIDLGQIAPYETTERGRNFIQSMQSGFKVGWLNARKRTEEEQARRLDEFRKSLSEHLEQSLVWPLQREIREFVFNAEWTNESFVQGLEELEVTIEPGLFHEVINPGALESAEYPYQYVKDVVGRVKTMVRTRLNRITDSWPDDMVENFLQTESGRQEKVHQIQEKMSTLRNWLAVDDEEQRLTAQYARIIANDVREKEHLGG